MAHAQKADFVFQRNERAHLYRWGCQFSRLLSFLQCGPSENDCIIVSKYVDLLPCDSVCHQIPFSLLLRFVLSMYNSPEALTGRIMYVKNSSSCRIIHRL